MPCTRHILLEHAHNFRDLGGYPTADGRVTKWGILYRSDALSALSEEEWECLKKLGITLVIDLRSKSERESNPITPPQGIHCSAHSLMGELDRIENSEAGSDAQLLGSMVLDYTKTLFGNIDCAAEILDEILTQLGTAAGGTVFLCSAGKDRTGITAAMLLYLCAVPDEDIVADYMVSNNYNTEGINQMLDHLPPELEKLVSDPSVLQKSFASDPETMRSLLESFAQRDLRRCLADAGFTEEKQQKLADAMLETI